jgi:hypothetical protein
LAVSFFKQTLPDPNTVRFSIQYMTVAKTARFKMAMLSAPALAVALALAACHAKPEVVAEPASAPTYRATDETSKEIPADLYKGMPIYPGAVVEHVRKPKGAMREVMFELKNSPPLNQMVSFYKDGFKQGDFKITSSLIMPARKTWSCDFHKDGRPGSVMLYPADDNKNNTTIDLIYEMASNIDPSLLEPKEDFDVIGPGPPGAGTPVAENDSQDKAEPKDKAKRN